MPLLILLVALVAVTVFHEAGHYLAVLARRGRVLRLQVGRGPVLWQRRLGHGHVQLSAVPLGGRIHYEGVPEGSGQAVVAVSGAAANLLVGIAAFLVAGWLGVEATPFRAPDLGPLAFATASTGAWFWAVPGAIIELVGTGSALGLRRAVAALVGHVAGRPLLAFPYAMGALSSLWAALNLIPVPVLDTDGWHAVRSLLRRG